MTVCVFETFEIKSNLFIGYKQEMTYSRIIEATGDKLIIFMFKARQHKVHRQKISKKINMTVATFIL